MGLRDDFSAQSGISLDLFGILVLLPLFQRRREREGWTGNTILPRGPCAQVCHLASFGAEGTPRIAGPRDRLATSRADHAVSLALLEGEKQRGSVIQED